MFELKRKDVSNICYITKCGIGCSKKVIMLDLLIPSARILRYNPKL